MTTARTLSGQVAIVTGAASGIGRAVATALLTNGCQVVLADRDRDGMERTLDEVRHAHAAIHEVDVTDPAAVDNLFHWVSQYLGCPQILVHSAGVGMERSFVDTSDEDWRRLIDINLSGTFYCNRAAARHMSQARYGRIVNLASTAGVVGGTGRTAYGASKGGVIMLTRVLAVEMAPFQVTVNALAPGAIETELVKRMHSDTTRRVYLRGIPLDRYGTPQEVAAAALFLVDPAASYVTGHVLAVDGGFLAAGVLHKRD